MNRTNYMTINNRFNYWTPQEKIIRKSLAHHFKVKVIKPTKEEDTQLKIDGWIIFKDKKYSIQIKCRDKSSGNDFGVDVSEPYVKGDWMQPPNRLGRDMRSKADFLVFKNKNAIYFIKYIRIKEIVSKLHQAFIKENKSIYRCFISDDVCKIYEDGLREYAELRCFIDKCNGNKKIMAFIPITMIPYIKIKEKKD